MSKQTHVCYISGTLRRKEQGISKCGARKPGSGWTVMDNEGTSCVPFLFFVKSVFGRIGTLKTTYLHLRIRAKNIFLLLD